MPVATQVKTGFAPLFLLGTLYLRRGEPLTATHLASMTQAEVLELAQHPKIQSLLMGEYQPCWLVSLGMTEELFPEGSEFYRRYTGLEPARFYGLGSDRLVEKGPANPHDPENWLDPIKVLVGEGYEKTRLFVDSLGVTSLVVKPHSYEWCVAVRPREDSYPWVVGA